MLLSSSSIFKIVFVFNFSHHLVLALSIFKDDLNLTNYEFLSENCQGPVIRWDNQTAIGPVYWIKETWPNWPANQNIPQPHEGNDYLRVQKSSSFGVANLQSYRFKLNPGDGITFDFIILSKFHGMNNIELYWMDNNNEGAIHQEFVLISLINVVDNDKSNQWQTISSPIVVPLQSATEVTLVLYGYLGGMDDKKDAIAIGNFHIVQASKNLDSCSQTKVTTMQSSISDPTTIKPTAITNTEPTMEPTTPEQATTDPTTTEQTTTEPFEPTTETVTIEPITTETTNTESTAHTLATLQYCLEDYSPCSCTEDSNGLTVTCDQVSMADVQQVLVNTKQVEFYQLKLTLPSSEQNIPSNLAENKHINILSLFCVNNNTRLSIDSDAFLYTSDFTKEVEISNCDLNQFSFSFLSDFNFLGSLMYFNCKNIHKSLTNLPMLPNLFKFEIQYSQGLSVLIVSEFPKLAEQKLTHFILINDVTLTDAVLGNLVDWILPFSSNSLQYFTVQNKESDMKLSSIPANIASFKKLIHVDFSGNNINIIQYINFAEPVQGLFLNQNKIGTIYQSGVFKGDFSGAIVRLQDNQMTRLEASVFQTMLAQMSQSNGFLDVANNPFDCTSDPNHLNWLINNNPGYLNTVIFNATCSDGRPFTDLVKPLMKTVN